MTKVMPGREKSLSVKQFGRMDYAVFCGDSCLIALNASHLSNNQYFLRISPGVRVRDVGGLPHTAILTGTQGEVDERVKRHAEYIVDYLVEGNFEGMLAVRR